MQIRLLIINDLLQLNFNMINPSYQFFNIINPLINFFRVFINRCSLLKHLLKQLFFYALRIVVYYLYHYVFERFNLFILLFIINYDVIFVLFV